MNQSLLAYIAIPGSETQRDTSGLASVILSYQYLTDNAKDNLFLIDLYKWAWTDKKS